MFEVRKAVAEFICPHCGNKWEVDGDIENGFFDACDVKDEQCHKCGSWGENT